MRALLRIAFLSLIAAAATAAATSAASNQRHVLALTKSPTSIQQDHDLPSVGVGVGVIAFCKSYSIPFCLLQLRAGSLSEDDYDDEEEEYISEDEEEIYHRRGRPSPPRLSSAPPLPQTNKKRKPKHWTQRMASQSLQLTSKLAWNTVKQPGKLAYHLIRPKHVDLPETGGLWRLDQQVTMKGDRQVASVATIELNARKRLVILRQPPPPQQQQQQQQQQKASTDDNNDEDTTKSKETVIAEPYTFTKSRLGSYKTSFVAPAFLVGDKTRLYGYKGTWQRKVADTKVIKLVGKIYNVKRQRFGKGKGSYQFDGPAVGTFVARRRIQMTEEEEEEDVYDDDEEYDNDQEYDDEGYDLEDEQ
jgi:hypothetical protein